MRVEKEVSDSQTVVRDISFLQDALYRPEAEVPAICNVVGHSIRETEEALEVIGDGRIKELPQLRKCRRCRGRVQCHAGPSPLVDDLSDHIHHAVRLTTC